MSHLHSTRYYRALGHGEAHSQSEYTDKLLLELNVHQLHVLNAYLEPAKGLIHEALVNESKRTFSGPSISYLEVSIRKGLTGANLAFEQVSNVEMI
jgi:hypothetical protein